MNNNSQLDDNQKLLVDAFRDQNEQQYHKALEKLALAGDNLINIIEKIEASPEFYMKYMQLMKDERELISERDYKEFLAKNQKVLSRNFEKNAYLALLMQEMEEKELEDRAVKISPKEEVAIKKMIKNKKPSLQEVEKKFPKVPREELCQLYDHMMSQPGSIKVENMDIQYS